MAWIAPIAGGLIKNITPVHDSLKLNQPVPMIASFEINNSCNQKCQHCFISKRLGSPIEEQEENVPLYALMRKTVDLGIQIITISGKEVLLDDTSAGCLRFLNKLKAQEGGFHFGFNTNGTNIRRYADMLDEIDFSWMTISMDGFKDTHDSIRGAGSFAEVDGGIRKLLSNKRIAHKLEISTTLNEVNKDETFRLSEYLQSLGVRYHTIGPVMCQDSGGRLAQETEITELINHYLDQSTSFQSMEVYFGLAGLSNAAGLPGLTGRDDFYRDFLEQDCFELAKNIHVLFHNTTRFFRITSDGYFLRGGDLFTPEYKRVAVGRPDPVSLPSVIRETLNRDKTINLYKPYFQWLNKITN